jgi:hypothetical protein
VDRVNHFDHYDHYLERNWRWLVEDTQPLVTSRKMFSTGSEENFVEITGDYFTKLLQTRTYNILHTSAA